jgi:hypothetical protein
MIHLTERFDGKEVYIIGTMNRSNMLAQRTKKLIEELGPDVVLVQTSSKYKSSFFIQFSDGGKKLNSYSMLIHKKN